MKFINVLHLFVDERLDRLEDLLHQIISSTRNTESAVPLVSGSGTSSSSVQSVAIGTDSSTSYNFWTWEGKLRPVPQDYVYPKKVPLKTMHDLWYEGVPLLNIRPFKFIKATLLHTKVEAQAQCRAKTLVTEINKYLAVDYTSQTAAVRDSAFKEAFDSMADAFSYESAHNKKADHSMSYTTIYEKYYVPYNKRRKLSR